jgi:hypothetical protein
MGKHTKNQDRRILITIGDNINKVFQRGLWHTNSLTTIIIKKHTWIKVYLNFPTYNISAIRISRRAKIYKLIEMVLVNSKHGFYLLPVAEKNGVSKCFMIPTV